MDLRFFSKFLLLIFVSSLCLQITVECKSSVVFLDSPSYPYLRKSTEVKYDSLSLSEVGAAVSILLGLAPPVSLPTESATKLDEILLPNPFDRPHAVISLEVGGIDASSLFVDHPNFLVGNGPIKRDLLDSTKAEIDLTDDVEISLISLNDQVEVESGLNDQKLHDFANWLGGSYVGTLSALDGELTLPLANGMSLKLHMSKDAERDFAVSLASLVYDIRTIGKLQEDFAESLHKPTKLLTGYFTGIQSLQKQYGSGSIAELGMEIFATTLSKLFDSLQVAYKGKIVGVVLYSEKDSPDSGSMLNVKLSPRISRLLEEDGPIDTKIGEVLLVRRTLAWLTGIILIIATLIGTYFLLNMPLTRDTLLYSNVKLD